MNSGEHRQNVLTIPACVTVLHDRGATATGFQFSSWDNDLRAVRLKPASSMEYLRGSRTARSRRAKGQPRPLKEALMAGSGNRVTPKRRFRHIADGEIELAHAVPMQRGHHALDDQSPRRTVRSFLAGIADADHHVEAGASTNASCPGRSAKCVFALDVPGIHVLASASKT